MKLFYIIIFCLASVSTSWPDTYKYIDDKGTPSFTDNLKNIPEKYRKNAVLIGKDDDKVTIEASPQAGKIDESLLPKKEEIRAELEIKEEAPPAPPEKSPYMTITIISSVFLLTLIPSFFVSNKIAARTLKIVSLTSMLTLLLYISVFFASKHMRAMKEDAEKMKEAIRKKEEMKNREIQQIIGITNPEESINQ